MSLNQSMKAKIKALYQKFQRPIRFGLVGLANTLISYLLYLFFLLFMHYTLSTSLSFIITIFVSYYLNSIYVFHVKPTLKRALIFPSSYLVNYLISIFGLVILIEYFGIPEKIAPILALIVTVPCNYIIVKFILTTNVTSNENKKDNPLQ